MGYTHNVTMSSLMKDCKHGNDNQLMIKREVKAPGTTCFCKSLLLQRRERKPVNLFQKKSIAWHFADLGIQLWAVNSFPLWTWETTVIKTNTKLKKKKNVLSLCSTVVLLPSPSSAASACPTIDFKHLICGLCVALLHSADCWLLDPGVCFRETLV